MPQWKTYESSVRLISAILAAHPELKLNYQQISACFGGDCTKSALENRFRVIKIDAKRIRDAVDKGIDPGSLELGGMKEIAHYYDEVTACSLEHRFRPIKKLAQDMRAGRAGIANEYGDGVTAKAVSTRFERLKKEPTNVANSSAVPTGTTATGTKRSYTKRTPKKTAATKNADTEDDDEDGNPELDDDEEDEEFAAKKSSINGTPKKATLHRTVGGRVNKSANSTPRKNGQGAGARAVGAGPMETINLVDDEEDFPPIEAFMSGGVKTEEQNYNNGFASVSGTGAGMSGAQAHVPTATATPVYDNGFTNGSANFNGHVNGNGQANTNTISPSHYSNGHGNATSSHSNLNGTGNKNGTSYTEDADMEDHYENAQQYADATEQRYMSEVDDDEDIVV